jgi:hypothetical protein
MSEWSRRFSWGASGAVGPATEEGRALLQERLALFGQVAFLVDSGFVVLGAALFLRSRPVRGRESPLPAVGVSLEQRLAGAAA